MLLSFAPAGTQGAPAILFRAATPKSASDLRNAVEPLMAGISRQVLIHELAEVAAPPGFAFTAIPGLAVGVRQLGPQDFVWEETLTGWLRVYDLLEPFAMPPGDAGPRSQPLHSAGGIAVILSTGETR